MRKLIALTAVAVVLLMATYAFARGPTALSGATIKMPSAPTADFNGAPSSAYDCDIGSCAASDYQLTVTTTLDCISIGDNPAWAWATPCMSNGTFGDSANNTSLTAGQLNVYS